MMKWFIWFLELNLPFRLDEIINEIDRKHARYQRNAVMRARFLLSSCNNMEGKISQILADMVKQLNEEAELIYTNQRRGMDGALSYISPEFLDNESQRTIPVSRKLGKIDELGDELR